MKEKYAWRPFPSEEPRDIDDYNDVINDNPFDTVEEYLQLNPDMMAYLAGQRFEN